MTGETLILAALVLPLCAIFGISICRQNPNLREAFTLVFSILLLGAVMQLLSLVLTGARPELLLLEMLPGIEIRFEVEPLGMLFAAVAAILWPINSLYSIGYMRGNNEPHQTRFYIFFAIALGAARGVAFAGNLVTLFVFYEVLTLSTFPLVAHKGNQTALIGARTYLGILLSTSIGLLLPAIVWTWLASGTTEFRNGGILAGHIEGTAITLLALLYLFGVGKAAVMPVHRWLPAAMVAPTPVSALLHAVAVVKAGVFSLVKIVVYVFGLDLINQAPGVDWLLWIVCFTIIAASVVALRQDNLKKRLAYSTIGQLSYVVLGAVLLAPISITGAALHIIAHAFGKITLFFAAGSIYTSCKKTEISQLDGIGRRMPFTMTAFSIGALSMIGVPPAAGFLSKWYLLMGAFQAEQLIAVAVIIISTALNAAYFVPIIYSAWFKRESSEAILTYGESPWPAVTALCMTAALTVLLFLFPQVPFELVQLIST
ncbi:MAG: proton-conducting transporter membrane subunit [Gammaproteobacteria bacterium]